MLKHIARTFALALILAVLSTSTIHAQATSVPPPPPVPAVTGGDPEPTSPTVVQTILAFLYLA
jgi:hypothetical protein